MKIKEIIKSFLDYDPDMDLLVSTPSGLASIESISQSDNQVIITPVQPLSIQTKMEHIIAEYIPDYTPEKNDLTFMQLCDDTWQILVMVLTLITTDCGKEFNFTPTKEDLDVIANGTPQDYINLIISKTCQS